MPSLTPSAVSAPALKSYLDPKIDLAFKRVFGEHADVLKSFLNARLPLPDDGQIKSLEHLTPEQAPEVPGLFKHSIVDVKCADQQGRIFIVEMQRMWRASSEARMVFGASQAYVKQLGAGEGYDELRPVYALALINQVHRKDTPEYYHRYRIVNVGETPEAAQTLKGLEFVFIELPKFKPQSRTQKRLQTPCSCVLCAKSVVKNARRSTRRSQRCHHRASLGTVLAWRLQLS